MGRGPGKRILLIDHDPAVHEEFRRILCGTDLSGDGLEIPRPSCAEGFEIDSATVGREGLLRVQQSLYQHRPYMLVIANAQLAGDWDGVHTVRQIWGQDPALPVLIGLAGDGPMPGRQAVNRAQIMRRLGSIDRFLFLPLPPQPDEVRQLVAAQVDRRLARLEVCAELDSLRRALDRTREQAEHAHQGKSEFMANVSHEIRTPISAILGFTRLLLKEPLGAEQSQKLRHVYDAALALSGLIDDVLDFSKLAAGQVGLAAAPFQLAALFRDVLKANQPAATQKGLALECRVLEAVPRWLHGDRACFRRILMHLVGNAVKFTETGAIHIQAALDEETAQTATVRVVVRDTGPGIPVARQSVIFDSFSQADGSPTRKFGGLGLGLAICRQLVELMGGQIGFRSAPGEGSSFWIALTFGKHQGDEPDEPVTSSERATPSSAANPPRRLGDPGPALRTAGPRVLVAEGDPLNRTLAEMLLSRAGCLVDLSGSGREAIGLLKHTHYDLVWLDIEMPETNGLEAIAQIRREQAAGGRRVPILAMTAHALPGDRQRCLQAGADECIPRSVSPDALLATLWRHLPGGLDPAGAAVQPATPCADRTPDSPAVPAEHLRAMQRALRAREFHELEGMAGSVKSLSLQAGFRLAADHAMRVQLAARSSNAQQAASALRRLEASLLSCTPERRSLP